MAAYVLSEVTSGWLRRLASALGMAHETKSDSPKSDDFDYDIWPKFVDERAAIQIERGIRSLELLQSARPGHPACQFGGGAEVFWVWKKEELVQSVGLFEERLRDLKQRIAWSRKTVPLKADDVDETTGDTDEHSEPDKTEKDASSTTTSETESLGYPEELAGMATFDHLPASEVPDNVITRSLDAFNSLLESFPNTLPPSAPTVNRLIQAAILEPLVAHSQLLSQSLLDVFLTDLKLLSHMDLLHRFMLFGDAHFVAKLRVALCDERPFSSQGEEDEPRLGLGLNAKLSPMSEWPPSGFGLSHSLRSVIVETLVGDHAALSQEDVVSEEAEWRMGFIVPHTEDTETDRSDSRGMVLRTYRIC